MPVRSKWQSLPTEAINPATLGIDKLSPADIIEGMLGEDRKMLAAVQREKDRIVVGVGIVAQALQRGGRIVFVGAGTSGRLGVLESAGLEFDALWVSGLTDETWPLAAQPNPFIPPALQRKAEIPEASAQASLARGRRS